jgi:hypothetical protein
MRCTFNIVGVFETPFWCREKAENAFAGESNKRERIRERVPVLKSHTTSTGVVRINMADKKKLLVQGLEYDIFPRIPFQRNAFSVRSAMLKNSVSKSNTLQKPPVVMVHYAAVNVNSVPPWSDTRHLLTLGEKNRGPEFDTFSPGTEYHFARNSFFPQI